MVRERRPAITVVNMHNAPQHAKKRTSVAYQLRTMDLPKDRLVVIT